MVVCVGSSTESTRFSYEHTYDIYYFSSFHTKTFLSIKYCTLNASIRRKIQHSAAAPVKPFRQPKMTSFLSSNIVGLNNQALEYMMLGNHNETVGALGAALSNLRMYQDAVSSCSSLDQSKLPLHKTVESPKSPPLCSIPLTAPPATACTSMFTLFHRALAIPHCNAMEGNTDRIMAVLLYNMGLSLHLQALRSGRTTELNGALQLYEMAFAVVEDAWSELEVNDLMLLLLALFNNMGHIHSSRFDNVKTRTCLDWLKTLAANPVFQALMERPEYAPFFLKLLVSLKQGRHVCSPAA